MFKRIFSFPNVLKARIIGGSIGAGYLTCLVTQKSDSFSVIYPIAFAILIVYGATTLHDKYFTLRKRE